MNDIAPLLVEWFDEHYYKVTVEGVSHFLPSVTTKLQIVDKPNLARWRGDIGNREADFRIYESSQRGKRVHWAWETVLKGGACLYDPWQHPVYTAEGIEELKNQFKGNIAILRTQDEMYQITKLQRQFTILKPHVLGIEEKVFDLKNRDAGTIDHIYYVNQGEYLINGKTPLCLEEGIYIGDLKTGNYIDNDVWMQLAPYAVMWEEMHGIRVQGALVTHTGATIKSGIPGLKTLFRPREMLFNDDYQTYRHAAALWERSHSEDQPAQFNFPALVTLKLKETQNVTTTKTQNKN